MKKVFGVLCVDDGLTQEDLVEAVSRSCTEVQRNPFRAPLFPLFLQDGADLQRCHVVCRGITRERLRSFKGFLCPACGEIRCFTL